MKQRLLVLGGGFAGLWAAASAIRTLDQARALDRVEVVLVNADAFHVIRVRCYEADLAPIRLPLDEVLGPIGVRRIEAKATGIDIKARSATLASGAGAAQTLGYDRLVLATGSALTVPAGVDPGQAGFDVDSFAGAERLQRHLASLPGAPPRAGLWTAVVIGGGLVGIELACELRDRLAAIRPDGTAEPIRVLLLDHGARIGAGMGDAALPSIDAALSASGVALRGGVAVAQVDAGGVTLADGNHISAATVVWATGMRASPLAACLGVTRDGFGRLPVDAFLQVDGTEGIYAAGDIASAAADGAGHRTVMSCQHARPLGRFAGHNAACDLLGQPQDRLAFEAPDYVTVLDLGAWGAVYTSGWDRSGLVASGAEAKQVKQRINGERIYPPRGGDRQAILAAAAPIIQAAPARSG